MRTHLFTCVLILISVFISTQLVAQESQAYQAGLRDHIAVDAGIQLPFGDVGKGLDLGTAFGFNLHFWKAVAENAFVIGSIGNANFALGSAVQTDSGVQNLSSYTLQATPLLGGLGWTFASEDANFYPFVIASVGVTFVTANHGNNRPLEEINNEPYFTVAGTGGAAYTVSRNVSILFSVRYVKTFNEDLQHVDIGMGASFRW